MGVGLSPRGGRRMAGKSRVSREAHARFCERLGEKFPGATRPQRIQKSMSWPNDLKSALSALTSTMANASLTNDTVDVDARRDDVADVLARHPAIADLLPTSENWHLHSLTMGLPCTTERLLLKLIDGLLETSKSTGIENAVRNLDNLLTDAEKRDLPGYELTFFRGLKLTERWDIAPGLYALPYPALEQQLRRRVQRIPDSLMFRIDPRRAQSIAVLVSEIHWGPIIVSTKGRTLSDPYPVEMKLVYDHAPLLLVALMAVTLNRPLWILSNTLRADPWVENFLNVEGGGGSLFSSPSHLESQTFPEASPETVEITERAFRDWDTLPRSGREVLALAISRLSESLSRTGMLAGQDRVLDISIALEILYQLGHLEITYKLSTRAGWYLENDFGDRVETRNAISKFYGLRSQIIHGGMAKRGRKQKNSYSEDDRRTRDKAFDVARRTLLQHLKMGKVPTEQDWSEIVMGANAAAEG